MNNSPAFPETSSGDDSAGDRPARNGGTPPQEPGAGANADSPPDLTSVQAEAARLVEMTQSTLSKCENGDRRIDIIELMRFAEAYEKDIEYFLPEDLIRKR